MAGFLSMGLFSCFIPLLFVVIAAECVRVLCYTLLTPSKPAGPSCGKCGYSVEGLPTTSCPECGSALGQVGVNTRFLSLRHRGNLLAAIIAWTTLVLGITGVATLIYGILGAGGAFARGAAANQMVWTTPLVPNSKGYSMVDVVSTASTKGWTFKADSIDLKLTLKDQTCWTLKYSGSSGCYLIEDPSGALAVPLTPLGSGGSASLFKAAGLDTTNAAIGAEVAELDQVVSIVIMSPYTQPSQMTLSQFVAGTPAFSGAMTSGPSFSDWLPAILTAATAFVVWLLGIGVIVVRRRRVLARCAGQGAQYEPYPEARPGDEPGTLRPPGPPAA